MGADKSDGEGCIDTVTYEHYPARRGNNIVKYWGFMFGSKKPAVTDVRQLKWSDRLRSPDKRAIIRIGIVRRLRSNLDISSWLRIENTFREVFKTELAMAVMGLIVACLAVFGFSRLPGIEFSDPLALIVAAMVFAGAGAGASAIGNSIINQMRSTYAHRDDKREGSDTLSLNFSQAEKVTNKAQEILSANLGEKKIKALSSVTSDATAPYRIIKKLLPIGPFFFRRPRRDQEPILDASSPRYRKYRFGVDMTDALCAGILGIANARPRLRYSQDTDKPLAIDRFWRSDAQEMHDTGQLDVFLRFHQSTVDGDFPPTDKALDVCTYKTFAAINNFRQTPLYLLRVSDVIDVLRGRHPRFDKALMEQIYNGLPVTPEKAFELLQHGKFAKLPPRLDRYQFDTMSDPVGRPILAFADDDTKTDIIMSFDPGRVWPRQDAAMEYSHAIVALRRAVHMAATECTIPVVLKRRDVLLVDNLRVLIRRREDDPTSIFDIASVYRDTIAATFSPFAGRWLRQIYGFPLRKPSAAVDQGEEDDAVATGFTVDNVPEDGETQVNP